MQRQGKYSDSHLQRFVFVDSGDSNPFNTGQGRWKPTIKFALYSGRLSHRCKLLSSMASAHPNAIFLVFILVMLFSLSIKLKTLIQPITAVKSDTADSPHNKTATQSNATINQTFVYPQFGVTRLS